jgi:hypothetical protein
MSTGLCQRRHWPEPRYAVSYSNGGYRCKVMVNNREYQTTRLERSEQAAREAAALIAFNICRSFSANDGMYPTGFAHGGVIQGNPVPVGSGRHTNRDSNSSLDTQYYDSPGSRSGGSSPEFGSRHAMTTGTAAHSSRHTSGSRHSEHPAPSRQPYGRYQSRHH